MDIQNIALIGDSAGGHLCIALTLLCIMRRFRKPDGLSLIYPACCSNINHFFPSNLLALDDPLLTGKLMNYVATAFMSKGGDATKNMILTPVYTPLEILAQMPKTWVFVCEVDPLRD